MPKKPYSKPEMSRKEPVHRHPSAKSSVQEFAVGGKKVIRKVFKKKWGLDAGKMQANAHERFLEFENSHCVIRPAKPIAAKGKVLLMEKAEGIPLEDMISGEGPDQEEISKHRNEFMRNVYRNREVRDFISKNINRREAQANVSKRPDGKFLITVYDIEQ